MIRLFISDIDDCLARPFEPFDLATLSDLARHVREGGRLNETLQPAFGLLSGRAFPYVEAMSQLLGTRVPVVFEAGGGVFDRERVEVRWNPALTPEAAGALRALRDWLAREVLPASSLEFDFAKRAQLSLVGPDEAEVERVGAIVREQLEAYPDLIVYSTRISLDVMPRAVTKRQALDWLSEMTGVALEEMAYIGDSEGDLEALLAVGYGFCPANAAPAVREHVRAVTRACYAKGVLEAYRWCVEKNRQAQGIVSS